MLILVSVIAIGAVLAALANVLSYLSSRRQGRPYTVKNFLADWSLIVGLAWLILFEIHSESRHSSPSAAGTLAAFWPIGFVYFFLHLRDWTARTWDPGKRHRHQA